MPVCALSCTRVLCIANAAPLLGQDSGSRSVLNRQPADCHAGDSVDDHQAVEFRIRPALDPGSIDHGDTFPQQASVSVS